MAATGVGADGAVEGGDEFGTSGVVLHFGGIGAGVGEDAAVGGDDGGAGIGGFRDVAGNGSVVGSFVGFDTQREELYLFAQSGFDFGAERVDPGATDRDV